jgi:hypothetical protein
VVVELTAVVLAAGVALAALERVMVLEVATVLTAVVAAVAQVDTQEMVQVELAAAEPW